MGMSIRVEFYGLARLHAGCAEIDVDATSLGEALERIAGQLPELAATCAANGRLLPGYLANVNGREFTRDPQAHLKPGDTLLILSADMGG